MIKPNFDSMDEYLFAKQLDEIGIKYDMQIPFVIDEGFKATDGHSYRDSVYTPDFKFEHNGKIYIVEVKGFTLYDNPFKYRIADKLFKNLGYEFHKVKLSGSTADNTKAFYPYSSGKRSKAVQKVSINSTRSKQWFYRNDILSIDRDLNALKTPSTFKYGEVWGHASIEWHKEHLDDSQIDGDWFNDWVNDNYVIIGRGNDENKWKFVERNENVID